MNENGSDWNRRKLGLRIAKAFLVTAASGIFWLVLWFLTSMLLADFPEYFALFPLLAWGLIFFTFATTLTDGTIYKYIFIVMRAFFLIVYLAYATNYGVLTIKFEDYAFTVEFVPLLALMIMINLFSMARGILQAIEFASKSPRD